MAAASHTYIHTNRFLTRPTCQFASESGALRWRQKQLLGQGDCLLSSDGYTFTEKKLTFSKTTF